MNFKREFERIAVEVLSKCNKINHQMTEDILIREIDIFSKQTVIELAVQSNSLDFVSHNSIQVMLNNTWFGRIDPDTSYIKVIHLKFCFIHFTVAFLNRL